jgi:hypothetical protein
MIPKSGYRFSDKIMHKGLKHPAILPWPLVLPDNTAPHREAQRTGFLPGDPPAVLLADREVAGLDQPALHRALQARETSA